jgi:hypothetical protein
MTSQAELACYPNEPQQAELSRGELARYQALHTGSAATEFLLVGFTTGRLLLVGLQPKLAKTATGNLSSPDLRLGRLSLPDLW